MSSVSNGLYFLTVLLVSVMRVIYRKICHARYLYIKRNVEKVWGARYTLGARYLWKNTVILLSFFGDQSIWSPSFAITMFQKFNAIMFHKLSFSCWPKRVSCDETLLRNCFRTAYLVFLIIPLYDSVSSFFFLTEIFSIVIK